MTVAMGEAVAVLAGGAEGKSTLFRHVLGVETPPPGTVRIFGQDIARLRGGAMRDLRRRIGSVHQQGALFSSLSVWDNLMLPLVEMADLAPEQREFMASWKLELVGLGGARNLMPDQMSAGMVLRAAIARALVLDPRLILCDDIFSGLDRPARKDIGALLTQIRSVFRLTLVLFTPDATVAMEVADRIAVIHDGAVVACGDPQTIRDCPDPAIRRLIDG